MRRADAGVLADRAFRARFLNHASPRTGPGSPQTAEPPVVTLRRFLLISLEATPALAQAILHRLPLVVALALARDLGVRPDPAWIARRIALDRAEAHAR